MTRYRPANPRPALPHRLVPDRLLAHLVLLLATLVASSACGQSSSPTAEQAAEPQDPAVAMELDAEVTDESLERLRATMAEDPEGPRGDRAALVLGSRLVEERRPQEALEPLRRAVGGEVGREYAAILLGRAVIAGEIAAAYDEALGHLDRVLEEVELTPFARQEALYLAAKIAFLDAAWETAAERAAELADEAPEAAHVDEARWILAEARAAAGDEREALATYREIWYETPGSRWAMDARARLRRLEQRLGAAPVELSATERLDLLQALQRAGLHEPALEEARAWLAAHPRHRQVDEVLYREAISHYWLRHNEEVVRIARTLRDRYPSSEWTPAAALEALKALRRSNSTAAIRGWEEYLRTTHPRRPETREAKYNLAVYLGNIESEAEGTELLSELVATGGTGSFVEDALWKIVWFERRRGRTDAAVEALETLLARFPESGFRKAALYWNARFLESRQPERAVELYQAAAREYPYDYYGHRAGDRLRGLGAPVPEIESRPFPEVDLLNDAERRDEEAYRRAVELRDIGLYGFAAAELASLPEAATDTDLQFAHLLLLSRSGDTWSSIHQAATLFEEYAERGSRDPDVVPRAFWEIVYPYRYRQALTDAVAATGLPPETLSPYLVAALIRRESRFLPSAVSGVGATGLMQLMPATAERVAKRHGLSVPARSDLFDPEVNAAIGTRYLGDLLKLFDGARAPAIASYNAGEDVVGGWWRSRPKDQDLDEWIENIPYGETRLYVKKILGDVRNYEVLYGTDGEAGAESAAGSR